ncbi:M15 family metallopeptidase [Microbacterium radiodurans]|uniref:M15 family metallopeptidase n=1 Tax=Microbacterium radiodurans TaxID=661398 RepID=UPI001CC48233|nr:M15 family metallopeptidase [Microbacterium radiodurans]
MADPTDPESRRARRQREAATRPLPTRREARAAATRGQRRHPPAVYLRRRIVAGAIALALVGSAVGGIAAGVSALLGTSTVDTDAAALVDLPAGVSASLATVLPAPAQTGTAAAPDAAPDAADTAPEGDASVAAACNDPAVQQALDEGRDGDVIAAFGGGEGFRAAVANGEAPCIDLHQARHVWVVVNKLNALDPIDYWPEPQARAEGVQRTSGGHMRSDVAGAVVELARAAEDEGAGAIGVNSGFRSFDLQTSTYRGYVGQLGQEGADLTSARPGYSEHQTGLAVDVVACADGCGTIERFGGTAQSEWVAANAWRFGFIVRYGDGDTPTTGYEYEPWHLRYVGVDLARAYSDGGYRTLEDFFGLPAAPDYAD